MSPCGQYVKKPDCQIARLPDYNGGNHVRNSSALHTSRLHDWHRKRCSATSSVVQSDLANFWSNEVIPSDTSKAYQIFATKSKNADAAFCFVNMIAPSLIRSQSWKTIYELIGAIVNMPDADNIGVTIGPSFTSQKGQVYRQESLVNDKLAAANLNIDRCWNLQIAAPDDGRDERPLLHMGRVCLPMGKPLKSQMWRQCTVLAKNPSIGPAASLKTSDMQIVEDISDTALPASTDATTHMSPAEKVHQIGHEACLSVLRGFFNGLSTDSGRGTVVIVDLFPHTGDLLKAAVLFRQEYTGKLKYISMAQSEMAQQWLHDHVHAFMKNCFLKHELIIRGAEPLPEEMPKELMEVALNPPELLVAVWNKEFPPILREIELVVMDPTGVDIRDAPT